MFVMYFLAICGPDFLLLWLSSCLSQNAKMVSNASIQISAHKVVVGGLFLCFFVSFSFFPKASKCITKHTEESGSAIACHQLSPLLCNMAPFQKNEWFHLFPKCK